VSDALYTNGASEIVIKFLIFLLRHLLTLIRAHRINLLNGSRLAALINAWFTPDVTRVLVRVTNLWFFIIDILALSVIEVGPISWERCSVAWFLSNSRR